MPRVASLTVVIVTLLVLIAVEALRTQSPLPPTRVAEAGQQQSRPSSREDPPTTLLQRERLRLDREKFASDTALAQENLASQRERLRLDREKFASDEELEQKKLALQHESLKVEGSKASWAAFGVVVPLLAGLGTIAFGVWSLRKQAEFQANAAKEVAGFQAEAAKKAAELQFEIKAAELSYAGSTPQAAMNRAKALQAMFPERLPSTFLNSFNPDKYGGDREPSEEKKLLLELALKYPDQRLDILELWTKLFPFDKYWLERVRPVLAQPQDSRSQVSSE